MDKLYRDLTSNTVENDSVHLAEFPISVENYVNKMLESKMQKAQTISSLVYHSKKEMIRYITVTKVMIPVLDDNQRAEIEAVSDLIKQKGGSEEIVLLDDASVFW
jgi:isoleucyl-tRNA synthetase